MKAVEKQSKFEARAEKKKRLLEEVIFKESREKRGKIQEQRKMNQTYSTLQTLCRRVHVLTNPGSVQRIHRGVFVQQSPDDFHVTRRSSKVEWRPRQAIPNKTQFCFLKLPTA